MENTIRFNGIRKTGLAFFMIFALSAFMSKAAVNITSGAVLFLALLDIFLNGTYRDLVRNRFFLAFFLPLLLGFFLSLFSDSGLHGSGFFFSRYRFFFMFIPFLVFIREKKHILFLFTALSISGCLSVVYGFVQAHLNDSPMGFEGLFIVGRNSDLLASLCLMNTIFLFEMALKDNEKFKARAGFLISLALCVAAILVIGQRGAMLGLFVGLLFYGVFFNRKILLILIAVSIAGMMYLKSDHPLKESIKSITDLDTDESNLARLHLLGSGIPYVLENHLVTGTGDKIDEEDFKRFFTKQPPSFQKKYHKAMDFPGNFHNSFLQMAAEGGALFLAAYLAGIGYIVFRLVEGLGEPENRVFCVGALVVTAGAVVTYFFHGELYRYGGVVFYMALLSGCVRESAPGTLDVQGDAAPVKPVLYGAQGPITPAV